MTQYLISFDDGAMDTSPRRKGPRSAGPRSRWSRKPRTRRYVFGAGLQSEQASIVATDGTVTDGPYPETKEVIGGFTSSRCPHARRP